MRTYGRGVLAIAMLLASPSAQAQAESAPLAAGMAPLVSREIVAGQRSEHLEAPLSGQRMLTNI
jgi:hypothetical protein